MRSRRLCRLFFTSTACLAAFLASQAAAGASTGSTVSTSPTSGFDNWNCRPSAAHPEPVVLLHGLGGNGPGNFATLGPYLESAGFCVFAPTYGEASPGVPSGGFTPIPQSAAEIAVYIRQVLAATGAAK